MSAFACDRSDTPVAERDPPAIERGDDVVVERSAAVFTQGRVLSVNGDRLRIQSAESGELFEAPRQDSYRIPKAPQRISVGQVVVCKVGPTLWVPGRVSTIDGASSTVTDAEGTLYQLRPLNVIAPTAVTRLNIERHLESVQRRRAFLHAANAAGRPRAPKDWLPEPAEPVVAERGGAWLSARVRGIADGGIQLKWDDGNPTTAVDRDRVVPQPPHGYHFSPGGFALEQRPASGPEWRPVRIVEEVAGGFNVQDSDGVRHRANRREMVPLAPPPTP